MAKTKMALEQSPSTRGAWERSRTFSRNSAQVTYNNSAHLLLTPEVQDVLEGMLPFVLREAGDDPQVELYGTAASDEMEAHLVISIKTDLPALEAFALWDHVGDAVQRWTETLPEPQKEIALDIAVEVLWDVDHAAV